MSLYVPIIKINSKLSSKYLTTYKIDKEFNSRDELMIYLSEKFPNLEYEISTTKKNKYYAYLNIYVVPSELQDKYIQYVPIKTKEVVNIKDLAEALPFKTIVGIKK